MDCPDTTKDVRDFKRKISVIVNNNYSVHVYVVAVAKSEYSNKDLMIPSIYGTPICNESHDIVRDCYYCSGVDYLYLGEIPVNISLRLDGVNGWLIDAPIPMNIIKRYMSEEQKSTFNKWKRKFRVKDHVIETMQIKDVY